MLQTLPTRARPTPHSQRRQAVGPRQRQTTRYTSGWRRLVRCMKRRAGRHRHAVLQQGGEAVLAHGRKAGKGRVEQAVEGRRRAGGLRPGHHPGEGAGDRVDGLVVDAGAAPSGPARAPGLARQARVDGVQDGGQGAQHAAEAAEGQRRVPGGRVPDQQDVGMRRGWGRTEPGPAGDEAEGGPQQLRVAALVAGQAREEARIQGAEGPRGQGRALGVVEQIDRHLAGAAGEGLPDVLPPRLHVLGGGQDLTHAGIDARRALALLQATQDAADRGADEISAGVGAGGTAAVDEQARGQPAGVAAAAQAQAHAVGVDAQGRAAVPLEELHPGRLGAAPGQLQQGRGVDGAVQHPLHGVGAAAVPAADPMAVAVEQQRRQLGGVHQADPAQGLQLVPAGVPLALGLTGGAALTDRHAQAAGRQQGRQQQRQPAAQHDQVKVLGARPRARCSRRRRRAWRQGIEMAQPRCQAVASCGRNPSQHRRSALIHGRCG